jgi:hypothetical protein
MECSSSLIMQFDVLVSRETTNFCFIFMSYSFQFYCEYRPIYCDNRIKTIAPSPKIYGKNSEV